MLLITDFLPHNADFSGEMFESQANARAGLFSDENPPQFFSRHLIDQPNGLLLFASENQHSLPPFFRKTRLNPFQKQLIRYISWTDKAGFGGKFKWTTSIPTAIFPGGNSPCGVNGGRLAKWNFGLGRLALAIRPASLLSIKTSRFGRKVCPEQDDPRENPMRLVSFSHTIEQIRNRTKTMTRRRGFRWATPGMIVQAIDRSPRLGQGYEKLAVIEFTEVRRGRLDSITPEDVRDEGFPGMSPEEFTRMFCETFACPSSSESVTVLRFRYVDPVG
jgi:hypothetical protein